MPPRDPIPLEGARALVSQAVAERDHNLATLSKAIGRNATYLHQWIRYGVPKVLPERERHRLAVAIGLDEQSLKEGAILSETNERSGSRPEPKLVGKLDLPVYAAVEGGPGEIVISTDAIDMVRRPWFLEHVGDAYAVVVTGESMEPVYEAGDIVLVNPKLPPVKGKDAIFTSERFGGDFKASIKRFVRATSDHWIAKQFTPPPGQKEEVKFARAEWKEALRVVGKYVP